MPYISSSHYLRMKKKYREEVARHLAECARRQEVITYGELADRFGGIARAWGDALGGIAIRCHEKGWPLLPVVVVNKKTRMPSVAAVLYKDLGLQSESDIRAEQAKCFAKDWTSTSLLS
ncbi:hypothetical protein [Roseibium aggregatum]|uniref:Uncharacterized protein n=1 Tax=Roseibium aggregatum TaxID=187304 RepID=A0A926P3L5_9HYPH|nr:hypothetical protein [Roseibium aggregatum]MBD1549050.1 hypothetical protein [Roseibium aggregatum]